MLNYKYQANARTTFLACDTEENTGDAKGSGGFLLSFVTARRIENELTGLGTFSSRC